MQKGSYFLQMNSSRNQNEMSNPYPSLRENAKDEGD